MKRKIFQRVIGIFLIIYLLSPISARGQERQFPVKPINFHIGFAPGGAVGLSGTVISEGMRKYLKQPVLLNYKPGAAQGVAADFVKNCRSDGYNLFYAELETLTIKLIAEAGKLTFRYEDFEPIGAGSYGVHLLAVNAESPWKTMEDLTEDAKKSPGKISLGNTGFGTGTHLKGVLFCMKNGIVLNHIPYGGGGPLITSLLGKHVDAGISTVTAFAPYVKPGGGMRGLIVFDRDRNPDSPDIPTSLEKGIDITGAYYMGLLAPKGLPEAVRVTLVEAFKKTIEDPETTSALRKLVGLNIKYLTPNEINRQMEEYHKTYENILKTISSK